MFQLSFALIVADFVCFSWLNRSLGRNLILITNIKTISKYWKSREKVTSSEKIQGLVQGNFQGVNCSDRFWIWKNRCLKQETLEIFLDNSHKIAELIVRTKYSKTARYFIICIATKNDWTKNSKQQSHLLTRTINCWLITNCLSHSVSVLILIALLYPRLNFTKDRYCTFRDCFHVSTPAYTEKKSVLGQEIPHMKVSYKKSEV